ncbi:AMP-binding protein [Myxococcus stipitatus DSM 14675]|uniref:AMP-binding protein n=1 Tax=Myxococcus stipitatus (strain DSM 14675 / JCM 12634 / Mx s8) TaxID=1278073 RepID=L7U3N8_MYXSD|nr:alpha/beta fold hydrolase [Myxococcus stipitatus]AGC43386.1 AMP-binding protein [Myxococcus stipitatus DSM 14675]
MLGNLARGVVASPVTSLIERIELHAASRPDDDGLAFLSKAGAPRVLSWAKLHARIRSMGAALVQAGVQPGDILFVLSASPYEEVLGFLGAMAAGALPSILSFPSLKQSEERFHETLRPITLSTGARWVITSREFTGVVTRARLPSQVVEFPPEDVLDAAPVAALPAPSADFLQFSSGTTGLRKCVRITGEMMASQAGTYAKALGLGPVDRVASWLPLYHDMGLVACLLVPLYQGHLSVHMSPFEWLAEPVTLFQALSTYRATLIWLPNFAYKLCAERIQDADLEGLDLGSLRAFINCSEPVRHRSHEHFLRRFEKWGIRAEHLHACYAMAETTFAVTQTELGRAARVDHVLAREVSADQRAAPAPEGTPEAERLTFVSCGRVLEEMEVRIGSEAGERRVGEIQVRGSSRIPGYGVDGLLPLDAFTEDGWYKTGDLGYLAEGELYVSGRAKDLIIHRGHNVHPSDVEEVAGEVPGIKPGRLVVFGLFDDAAGTEDVIVMLEPEGAETDREALRRTLREKVWTRLNVTVADVDIVEQGTLRKSTSGKLSRSSNRKLYQERLQEAQRTVRARGRPANARPYVEPRDLWERQLAWIWEEVLGISPIGLEDNLFLELGADSVSATRAASEVERRLSKAIPPSELLAADTLARQAQLLRREEGAASSPLVTLQRKGEGRPFFLVHAAGGWAFPYMSLVRQLGEERPVHVFQAQQLFHGGAPAMTVERMAEDYLTALRQVQPRGPYLLGGWSLGGHVAFQMASRLQAEGEEVSRVVMFDTSGPRPRWFQFKARTLWELMRPLFRLSLTMPKLRAAVPMMKALQAQTPVWRFAIAYLVTGESRHIGPMLQLAFPEAFDPKRYAQLDEHGAWDYFVELALANHAPADRILLIPGIDGAGARRALAVTRRCEQLNARYRPARPYAGRVDIIGVRGNAALERWRPFVGGSLNIHPFDIEKRVMTPHFDMMDPSNVTLFVDAVRQLLREPGA